MSRNVLINRQFGRPSGSQSVLCVSQFHHVVLGIADQVCLGSAKQDWQRAICIPQGWWDGCAEWQLCWKLVPDILQRSLNSVSESVVSSPPVSCFCVCVSVSVQGLRDTPSVRAAQLGPQTLVNLFNSPLYSDVIFMVQGGFMLIC